MKYGDKPKVASNDRSRCHSATKRIRIPLAISMMIVGSLFAADDDQIIEPNFVPKTGPVVGAVPLMLQRNQPIAVVNRPRLVSDEDEFVHLLSSGGDSRALEQRFDITRTQAIDALSEFCLLTDGQKQKLDLAGQIDQRRFLNRIDAALKKMQADARQDENTLKEIQWLQSRVRHGIFGYGSFFVKSLRTTLDHEQLFQLDDRRSQIFSKKRNPLRDIEAIVAMEEEQKNALLHLMLDETPYDPALWTSETLAANYERMTMLYFFSCAEKEKIKSTVGDAAWLKLQPHLEEFQGFKLFLASRGIIDIKE